MTARPTPKVVIWPFLLMDVLFLGLAYGIVHFGHKPLLLGEVYAVIICVALGAWTFLKPFQTKLRMAESDNLVAAAEEIKKIEHIAEQIGSSTSLWHSIQEQAAKTAGTAKQVTEEMSKEAKAFRDFFQKNSEGEKATLRLEIDKLKQSEQEWLETLVRISDHIYSVHYAAVRSGQPRLIEQLSNFRSACFDTARRVGLNPYVAGPNEPFDPARHLVNGVQTIPSDAQVAETILCGYTFRGQLLRRAAVRIAGPRVETIATMSDSASTATATSPAPAPVEPKESKKAEPKDLTGELPLV